jgi:hypothetical protein
VSEKVICKELEQIGFRHYASADKACYRLNDEILNVLNNRTTVSGIFWNFRKGFDYVNHNILLFELEFYGITGTSLTLIKSYLEGRYQKVILNDNSPDSFSSWGVIRHGVPQERILGLLLSLIYINDLPKLLKDC